MNIDEYRLSKLSTHIYIERTEKRRSKREEKREWGRERKREREIIYCCD